MDTKTLLATLLLKNPIMSASGCFGFGQEFAKLYDLSLLGGIVLKSATLKARYGNPTPRVVECDSGMLNAIGLQNPGVDAILNQEIKHLEGVDTCVFANVAGSSKDEYVEVVKKMNSSKVIDAYELNISCPNVKEGGIAFGSDPKSAAAIVKMVKEVAKKPVFVKLSPNVTDIVEMAKAVEKAGADGVVLINTMKGMRFDIKSGKPLLANGSGGLSGKAIKPIALAMVYQVYEAINIPIIGVGGISSCEDVVEFLQAGASAVQVGMENFVDPYICPKLVDELEAMLKFVNVNSVKELIGRSHKL